MKAAKTTPYLLTSVPPGSNYVTGQFFHTFKEQVISMLLEYMEKKEIFQADFTDPA